MKKLLCMLLTALMLISFAALAEDGQNPAMNLIGPYEDEYSQRAHMFIECQGEDEALVTIEWACSAFENAQWVFSGVCDSEDLTIRFGNCVKSIVSYGEDGEIEAETVEYENGTGCLTVDPETGAIYWQDDVENQGENCVFVFAAN